MAVKLSDLYLNCRDKKCLSRIRFSCPVSGFGFIAKLQDSGVPFVACDMPAANEAMVRIMSVMAQAERKVISER